jgi:hypothetical protein
VKIKKPGTVNVGLSIIDLSAINYSMMVALSIQFCAVAVYLSFEGVSARLD